MAPFGSVEDLPTMTPKLSKRDSHCRFGNFRGQNGVPVRGRGSLELSRTNVWKEGFGTQIACEA